MGMKSHFKFKIISTTQSLQGTIPTLILSSPTNSMIWLKSTIQLSSLLAPLKAVKWGQTWPCGLVPRMQ
jgi:hypothetical protein